MGTKATDTAYMMSKPVEKTFNNKHWRAISGVQGHIYIHKWCAINNLQVTEKNSHLDPKSISNAFLDEKLDLEQGQRTIVY